MSEVFDGTVEIQDASASTTVLFDGNTGAGRIGGGGQDGRAGVADAAGSPRIVLAAVDNSISIQDAAGNAIVQVRPDGGVGIFRMVGGVQREVVTVDPVGPGIRIGTQGDAGSIVVHDGNDRPALQLIGQHAVLRVGAAENEGDVIVHDAQDREVFHVNGANAAVYVGAEGNEGDIVIRNGEGVDTIHLDGGQGDIFVRRRYGRVTRDVLRFDASNAVLRIGTTGNEGDLVLHDNSNREAIHLNAGNAQVFVGTQGNEGDVVVRDGASRDVIHLNGDNAAVYVGASGNEGDIIVRDGAGRDVFHMDGNNAALYIGASGNEGDIIVRDGGGRDVLHFNSEFAVLDVGADGNEGDIRVRDGNGTIRIHLNGGDGDIKLHGADCAERFDVEDETGVDEGTVLVIDDSGALCSATRAYDRRVAGVVSGAGSHQPGIILDNADDSPRRRPVALVGKVFCKVDAAYGPIGVGDLLTTSDTPGHAMRVGDPLQAFGAVIGKALAPLAGGRGLVPILVALQ